MALPAGNTRPSVAQSVLDRLKTAVGPVGYIDTPEDIAPYSRSWRGNWQGRSPLFLRPRTTEEMAAIVRICAETDTAIVPQGGNTGLTYGSQPGQGMNEVIVSTARMKSIREIDLKNDTITVEAGVVLQEIQRAAADVNRLFPLSLGAEGTCQIGGNISTNAGGIQVLRYGNTRNLVLGLEVVLPDGRIWDGLKGLRKDNTGYDLKQLFIGGEGTLGIITAAVLKLFPKPTEAQSAWVAVKSPDAGVALLGLMRERLGESVSSFELISRPTIDLLLAGVPGHTDPMPAVHPWYVLTEVTGQGEPGSLAEPLGLVLEAAVETGIAEDAVLATSSEQAKRLWKMREDLPFGVQAAGGAIPHDVSVPLSRITEFIRRADAAMKAAYPTSRFCCFGHVGDGNLHYNPVRPADWTYDQFAAERENVNRIVHDIVVELGGSISAEHGIGLVRLEENLRYKSPVELDLMRRIKHALDPAGILNPGKLIVG
ncbi:MAG: FAD-binding oxidoreductase [Hyphomicrobiaceae bacterium]|nr:FAD-binding oxidoreductase [Hyphomicrobiaceae bacterium]